LKVSSDKEEFNL